MAFGPQADDIADMVISTLDDLGRNKWTEIATDLTEHVAMNSLMRKERVTFGGGLGIRINLMHTHSGAAAHQGLFENDNVNVGDVMTKGRVPWRHTTTNYAFDRREPEMNSGPAEIVNQVKIRRADAMISLAALAETTFWADPAADGVSPFGIQYWLVKSTSTGFHGGDPTNFSAGAADILSATYPRWNNYTDQYAAISKTDLVRKWRKAAVKTGFKPPAAPNPDFNTGNRYGYYTNYDVVGPLEEALEAQNQNLGNDVASKDGQLLFRQVPVTYVPILDGDVLDTIYGINWGVFKIAFLRGEYLRETVQPAQRPQHTVTQVHIDLSWNPVCFDRRRNFRLTK